MTFVLALAFFLSGAAALTFEIIWFHRTGLAFGNSVGSATIVLSSFMAGIAAGNAIAGTIAGRARRLLATYAALELLVATTGLAATAVLPRLSTFGLPAAIAFAVLVVPAAAMGATLPLLVTARRGLTGVRSRSDHGQASFGWALGTLYGWNTLGAVGIDCRTRGEELVAFVVGLMVGAALGGFALLALEVIWLRFLSLFVLTTTLTLSVMLAVVLAGISIGGLIAGWLTQDRPPTPLAASIAAVVASASVAGAGGANAVWRTLATSTGPDTSTSSMALPA